MFTKLKTDYKRFEEKILPLPNGCYKWTSYIDPTGYARFRFRNKSVLAHRFIWELENGPVPEGFDVGHKCHDEAVKNGLCSGGKTCLHRSCTNLNHLELQSRLHNIRAAFSYQKAKGYCPQGHEYNEANTKLTSRPGSRVCRLCANRRQREYTQRKKSKEE